MYSYYRRLIIVNEKAKSRACRQAGNSIGSNTGEEEEEVFALLRYFSVGFGYVYIY